MSGEQVLGIVAVGEVLDEVASAYLREVTGHDVIVLYDGNLIVESWRDPSRRLSHLELDSLQRQLSQLCCRDGGKQPLQTSDHSVSPQQLRFYRRLAADVGDASLRDHTQPHGARREL